jgi:hypothetical protein
MLPHGFSKRKARFQLFLAIMDRHSPEMKNCECKGLDNVADGQGDCEER